MGIINHCSIVGSKDVKLQKYKCIDFSKALKKYFIFIFKLYVLNNLEFALVYIRFFLYIFAFRSNVIGLQPD